MWEKVRRWVDGFRRVETIELRVEPENYEAALDLARHLRKEMGVPVKITLTQVTQIT